jgi:rubrerythrin
MANDNSAGTRDVTYNLISVVYHALQGADTYHTYVRDAETDGDEELAGFFREAEQQSEQLAARAKELLGQRMK